MKQVLIVEDEPIIQRGIERVVGLLGHKTFSASDGRSAVDVAQINHLDLILMDERIPFLSGLGALEQIRSSDGPSKNTPVIMVTGFNDKETIRSAISVGSNDFIVKPFDTDELVRKVNKWVNHSVEESWRKLNTKEEALLRVTLGALTGAFEMTKGHGTLPCALMKESCDRILNVVELGLVDGALTALKAHDDYTFVHSLRVGVYMSIFARKYGGFSRDELAAITMGALLHDVGKVKLPLQVLHKPSVLDTREYLIIKKHVDYTMEILGQYSNSPEQVIEIGRDHHERPDGMGYPNGSYGAEVGQLARMAAVVDAFVAITDRRIYKPAYNFAKAFEIMELSDGQFDEAILQYFKALVIDSGLNG